MPFDEIAEGTIRFVARVILRFLVETVFDTLCFYIGKPVVWALTAGRYPHAVPTPTQEVICSTVGLSCVVAIPLVLAW